MIQCTRKKLSHALLSFEFWLDYQVSIASLVPLSSSSSEIRLISSSTNDIYDLKNQNRQIIEVVSGQQYISFLSLASQQWLTGRYPWFACLPHARTEQTAADRQPARWLKAPDQQTLAASGYCLSLPCRIVPIEGKSLSGWIISNMPLNYDVKDNDNNFLSKW